MAQDKELMLSLSNALPSEYVWIFFMGLFCAWGIFEMICFYLFVPAYYDLALPIRRVPLNDLKNTTKEDTENLLKSNGIGFRQTSRGLLFRYPNIPFIQIFVSFGIINFESSLPSKPPILVAKTFIFPFVAILSLGIAGLVDAFLRNGRLDNSFGLIAVLLLVVLPIVLLPTILLQRLVLRRIIKLLCA